MGVANFHQKSFFKALAKKGRKVSINLLYFINHCGGIVKDSVPFLIACTVLLSIISLHSPILLLCLLLGSLIAVLMQQIVWQLDLPKHKLIGWQILAIAIILCAFWLDYFAAPAQAQFFGKAEDFFKNTLTQGVTNSGTQSAVGLVFNVLRALYLLYIAVALIGVVNAVRKDEDWQNIARTPLLVVVAVTIADVLTGFVIGS